LTEGNHRQAEASNLPGAGPVKKKILFLFDNFELSGADRIALNVARALVDKGVPVQLAVCMDVKDGFHDFAGELIRLSPPPVINESLLRRAWRGMVALLRCLRLARGADMIVCVTPPAAFVGSIAGWCSGTRSIPWVHYDLEGVLRESVAARGFARGLIKRFFYRLVVPLHRQLIFVSEMSRRSMAEQTRRGNVPAGWVVLPNITDASARASRSHESATLDRVAQLKAKGNRIVLFIGRIAREKRWDDVVEAARIMAGIQRNVKFVIIGDGPEGPAVARAAARSENVMWLGADPNPMPTLAISDALVLTSLYEAWPTVILEAFQLGTPVISYACPSGPREMIGSAPARGWLVDESPPALVAAIQECLATGANEIGDLRRNAHDYASRFLPGIAVGEWLCHLERQTAGRKTTDA
jgi:glycosyltransferase involved in cell wall biosynthesis